MSERDQEVEDFIRSCPRTMTYSEIGQGIRERFGEERAWSRTRIFNFWEEVNEASKGCAGRESTGKNRAPDNPRRVAAEGPEIFKPPRWPGFY